ncbi:MBL fold metallo-hydrolase [Streptomyces sp. MUM 203J]|uniref:MBL fold metallo-hydrolase n=1 Tax=Streptomyces sp. MUM 203J TaxID=2791990 RepID=UPI001F0476B6|nr:MBL fold metallo-hydrolase [Streptomyces sp. MUM 203J]MCH0542761.1 MBL fold metallo-hydrolase [Streptomyces sp. MUM 203J]
MDVVRLLPRLHMLRFPIGQAYVWRDGERDADGELTLVDAGWAGSAPVIERGLRGAGLRPENLRRIVLTHCHRDHVGAAEELAGRYGCEVVAHRLDAAHVRGEAPVPEPDLLEWEVPLYAHGLTVPPAPPTRVDREVSDGDGLGFGDGAVAVHTPGHTPGSMAVHLPYHGVLFTGDTVASAERVALGVFHVDRAAATASLQRLAALPHGTVTLLCCGHGEPSAAPVGDPTAVADALLAAAASSPASPLPGGIDGDAAPGPSRPA